MLLLSFVLPPTFPRTNTNIHFRFLNFGLFIAPNCSQFHTFPQICLIFARLFRCSSPMAPELTRTTRKRSEWFLPRGIISGNTNLKSINCSQSLTMSMTCFFIVFGTLLSADKNIALLPGHNTALLPKEDNMKKQPSRGQRYLVDFTRHGFLNAIVGILCLFSIKLTCSIAIDSSLVQLEKSTITNAKYGKVHSKF